MISAPEVRAFVQARMSSSRFPGKVLAPLAGRPVLARVLTAVEQALPREAVVVATSAHPTDDPVAAYVERVGVACFRGPLDDVLERFRLCHASYPSEWVLRVNADSPLLDPAVLERVLGERAAGVDLVTTTAPRTFPRGQNAELVRASVLERLPDAELTTGDREHVTAFIYRHPDRYAVRNVYSDVPASDASFAVDTIEDLQRLEELLRATE